MVTTAAGITAGAVTLGKGSVNGFPSKLRNFPQQLPARCQALLFIFAGTAYPLSALRSLIPERVIATSRKIVSDDAPAHVSFKSNLALIKSPPHSKAMLGVCSPGPQCPLSSLGRAGTSAPSVVWRESDPGRTQPPAQLLIAGQSFRWQHSKSRGAAASRGARPKTAQWAWIAAGHCN